MQQPFPYSVNRKSIRRRSEKIIFVLPLYDIAIGPDLQDKKEIGHARGIIAIGDVATGWLAVGGVARGLLAFGALSLGLFSLGGI